MKNFGLIFVGIMAAISIDVYGVVAAGTAVASPMIGEALSLVGDGVGLIFFAAWTSAISGNKNFFRNKKAIKKFAFTSLGEILPFVGALPLWTLFVITESFKSNKKEKIVMQDDDLPEEEEEEEDEQEDIESDFIEEEEEEEQNIEEEQK